MAAYNTQNIIYHGAPKKFPTDHQGDKYIRVERYREKGAIGIWGLIPELNVFLGAVFKEAL